MIKIDDKTVCSGCAACSNLCPQKCIVLEKDKMGFVYPAVDMMKCVDCGLCEQVCPGLKRITDRPNRQLMSYAAQNLDEAVRLSSSSGGIFTCIAQYILSQEGVVFGAAFDNTFRSVRHIAVQTLQDLYKIQGSKYVQSHVGSSYQMVKCFLDMGKLVLFSGTLCQIAGLKAFLHKDYRNLYLVDVVCYGVPAPSVWSEYLDVLENKYNGKVTGVSFRDKRKGWSNYVISIKFDNGKEYVNSRVKDPYMRGFLHDCYLRPACYKCNFKGLSRATDITLGDLWGIEHIAPELNDEKGTSLVMISSEKGKELFEKATLDVVYQTAQIEDVVKYNPAIENNFHLDQKRKSFEKDFGSKPITTLLNQYVSDSLFKKIMRKIKRNLNLKSTLQIE